MLEATKSTMYHKHGAVLVYRNKIIGRGHNYSIGSSKGTKRMKNGRWSIHAEIDAINSCKDQSLVQHAKMYVVRISPEFLNDIESDNWCVHTKYDFYTKDSKPCLKCQKALNKLNITKVCHS